MPAMSSEEKKKDIERYHRELAAKNTAASRMDSGVVLPLDNMDDTVLLIPGDNTKAKAILGNLTPGEPYFVFRAQDILSIFALEAYSELIRKYGGQAQLDSLLEAQEQFLEWQRANPGKVKLPD